MSRFITACFTGHRPQHLSCGFDENHYQCIKIKHQLLRITRGLIERKAVNRFISGMALGVDMWAAETVIDLREEYSGITLEAAVPCKGQEMVWRESLRGRYHDVLGHCDTVVMLQEKYTSGCMQRRNEYMVRQSDFVVAVWDGKNFSGTARTVKYALERHKIVYWINSNNYKMTEYRG